MTRHGGHVNNVHTNRVKGIRSTRVARRRTRNLILVNSHLGLNSRSNTRHVNRHRRNGRMQYKRSHRANNALNSRPSRLISFLLTTFRRSKHSSQRTVNVNRGVMNSLTLHTFPNRIRKRKAMTFQFRRHIRLQHTTGEAVNSFRTQRRYSRALRAIKDSNFTVHSRRRLLNSTSSTRRFSKLGVHYNVSSRSINR